MIREFERLGRFVRVDGIERWEDGRNVGGRVVRMGSEVVNEGFRGVGVGVGRVDKGVDKCIVDRVLV